MSVVQGAASFPWTMDPGFCRLLVSKSVFLTGGDLERLRVSIIDTATLRTFTLAYPGDDVEYPAAPFFAADATLGLSVPGGPTFAFGALPVRGGCELRAVYDQGVFTRALYVLTTAGYHIFRALPSTVSGIFATKLAGQAPVESAVVWPGPVDHLAYRPENVWWGLRNYDGRSFGVLINGHVIYRCDTQATIMEMGFGGLAPASNTAIAIRDWTLRTDMTEARGLQRVVPLLVGDSFTAPISGGWPVYFREALYGTLGIDIGPIMNNAISGQTSGQQLAALQATGVGNATHGIIMIGANDQQGEVALGTYKLNLAALIDYFLTRKLGVHFVVQTFFYDKVLNPRGFDTKQYDTAYRYRAAALRMAAEKGVGVTDLTSSLKTMLAGQLTDGSEDPGLCDSIHPTVLSRKLMGVEIARDFVASLTPPFTKTLAPFALPANRLLSGWGPGGPRPARLSVTADGRASLNGTISGAGASKAPGTLIGVLPRNCRPNVEAIYRGRGQFTPIVEFSINTEGAIFLGTDLTVNNDTYFEFSGVSFDVR